MKRAWLLIALIPFLLCRCRTGFPEGPALPHSHNNSLSPSVYSLFSLAKHRYFMGDFPGASSILQKVLHLDPKFARAHYYNGLIFQENKEYEKALKAFQEAVHYDPHLALGHYKIGLINLRDGNTNIALRKLAKALEIEPYLSPCLYIMGLINHSRGSFAVAKVYLFKALQAEPDNSLAYNALGCVLLDCKDYSSAIPILKKAASLNPEWYKPYQNLGAAFLAQGDFENALLSLQKAVFLNPENTKGYLFLGMIYGKEFKDFDKMQACFGEYLSRNPTGKEKEIIEEIMNGQGEVDILFDPGNKLYPFPFSTLSLEKEISVLEESHPFTSRGV